MRARLRQAEIDFERWDGSDQAFNRIVAKYKIVGGSIQRDGTERLKVVWDQTEANKLYDTPLAWLGQVIIFSDLFRSIPPVLDPEEFERRYEVLPEG